MSAQDLVVIDCDEQEIISHVDVGFSPVHMYAIPSREEVWTHPDDSKCHKIDEVPRGCCSTMVSRKMTHCTVQSML